MTRAFTNMMLYAAIIRRSCVCFLGLMLSVSALFMLPNDLTVPFGAISVLLSALCLSCLVIVVWRFRGARGSLAAAGAGLLAVWPTGAVVARQLVRGEEVEAALEGSVPLARGGFDVYLGDDATLIYVKESWPAPPCLTPMTAPWTSERYGFSDCFSNCRRASMTWSSMMCPHPPVSSSNSSNCRRWPATSPRG